MSKRLTDRERLLHKLQQMTDSEVEDMLNYVSMEDRGTPGHSKRDGSKDVKNVFGSANTEDELLMLLSTAYENRRALQVFEWEAARRRAEMKVGSAARG